MKIDVATMRTDRSAKIDTDSVQTAHRLYSHTSTEATETTDKSATSQKGMDAFLKMLLNTLCVEANTVTLNIPIMLLQPLVILLAHYVGSFQRDGSYCLINCNSTAKQVHTSPDICPSETPCLACAEANIRHD